MEEARKIKIPILKVNSIDDHHINFTLDNCQPHIASALRRILLSEIPTMSPHIVRIIKNDSPLPDEMIAHRIGLVPFVSEKVDNYLYHWECDQQHDSQNQKCDRCSEIFKIEVTNVSDSVLTVTSLDITRQYDQAQDSQALNPVKYYSELDKDKEVGIPILQLNPGSQFECIIKVQKGIGKMHAKWSPVSVAGFRYEPIIEIKDEINKLSKNKKKEFINCCPTKVFDLSTEGNIKVVEKEKCMYCDECTKFMAVEVDDEFFQEDVLEGFQAKGKEAFKQKCEEMKQKYKHLAVSDKIKIEIAETQNLVKQQDQQNNKLDDDYEEEDIMQEEQDEGQDENSKIFYGKIFKKYRLYHPSEIESFVNIQQKENKFIFNVEVTGSLKPASVVKKGFQVLIKKLDTFQDYMKDAKVLNKNPNNLN